MEFSVYVDEINKEGILASPITPEAQIAQIEADNELAQTTHADEQMGVDQALARQLRNHTQLQFRDCGLRADSTPNQQTLQEPADRITSDVLAPITLRNTNSCSQETIGEEEERTTEVDLSHPSRKSDTGNSSDSC